MKFILALFSLVNAFCQTRKRRASSTQSPEGPYAKMQFGDTDSGNLPFIRINPSLNLPTDLVINLVILS